MAGSKATSTSSSLVPTDSEWSDVLLEDLAAASRNALVGGPFGSDLVSADYSSSGVAVIRGENLTHGRWVDGDFVFIPPEKAKRLAANTAGPLDIVFTQRGANHYRQVAVVRPDSERFVISQSQMKLTVDPQKADALFVYYLFRAPHQQEYLQRNAIQTGVPHTNLSILREAPLRLPPLSVQRAIAHILGTLDDKIELNRRMDETLEEMARALFRSWFVDFDPVRAKAEGRDPGLPKTLADLFPDSFEESRLGEIPRGWRVGTLSDVAEINAKTLGRTDALEVIDYIEINEVMRGEIGSVVRYERGAEPSRARRRLRHGDSVLSTVRPDRGAYFLCLNPPRALIASTGFAVLSPRDGNWAFLYSALTRHEVGEELGRLADGGAYPAVRPEAIGALGFVIPKGSQIVSAFQKLAGPWFERAQQNRAEGGSLGALRDTLLPKLLSGGLRVKDAERIVAGQV